MSEQSLKVFEELYQLLNQIYNKMNVEGELDRNLLYQIKEIMRCNQLHVMIDSNEDSRFAGVVIPLVEEDLVFEIQDYSDDDNQKIILIPAITLSGNYQILTRNIFETNHICFYPDKGFETLIYDDHYVSVEIQIEE